MENLKKPNIFKRLGAMIFDILVWFLLSIFLLLIVVDPIANRLTDYNNKKYEYNMGLFNAYGVVYAEYKEKDDDFSYELIYDASYSEEDLKKMEEELLNGTNKDRYLIRIVSSKLNINVDTYMNKFYTSLGDAETYLKAKQENTDIFDENGELKSDVDAEKLSEFYTSMYTSLLNSEKFKNYEEGKLYNLGNSIGNIDTFKAYGAYLISLSLVYLLIPLISKRRQTLGKMVMKLMVVEVKTNETASRVQILIRFAALAIVEFLFGMLLSGFLYLPLLISIILMVVTLNQSALHDFIARTKVVEVPYVNPYLQRPIEEENGKEETIDVDFKEIDENNETISIEEEFKDVNE